MLDWLRRILAPPVYEDAEQMRVAKLLHAVLWVFVVVLLVAMCILAGVSRTELHTTEITRVLVINGAVLLSLVYLLWLIRRRAQMAAMLLVTMLWGVATLWSWLVGGITDTSVAWLYPLLIVFAGLLLSGRSAVVFAILSAVGIVGAYSAERAGRITPLHVGIQPSDLVLMVGVLATMTIMLFYGRRSLAQALESAQRSVLAQERANRQLETMQAGLEDRVRERTRDLEDRAALLRGVVEIGRAAVAMRAPDDLMAQVAESVAENFSFYHVGVYMLSESGNRAVLRATGGESGAELPAIGYEMSVEDGSVVGECVRRLGPRIALSSSLPRTAFAVGEALLSTYTARLPRTEVEVAVPLVVGGQCMGALDLHLHDAGLFKPEDLEAWQIAADQVAIAVENAQRFARSQAALVSERDFYGRISREGWRNLLLSQSVAGYRYRQGHVDPIGDTRPSEMDEALAADARVVKAESDGEEGGAVVAVPVRARGNTIGVMHLRKRPGTGVWTRRELALLDTLTDQLETALESARLYRDTRLAAAQQQAIAEVSASIREEVEIEYVLSRALTELGSALSADRGAVLFGLDELPEDVGKPEDAGTPEDVGTAGEVS